MSERPPVKDWATDFDHLDPRWVNDPYPIWDELRQKCPIAHTDRFKGVYLPTRYEDVRAIAYDPEHFSSRKVIVRESPPPSNNGAPPITSDPPRHRLARMVLLPPFTPQAIDKLVPKARQICNELIDGFVAKGSCDAALEYAQHIPVKLIAHMLGIPESDGDRFRGWIKAVLEDGITDEAAMMRGFNEIREYFTAHLIERRKNPWRRSHQLSHAAILSRRAPVHRQPRAR
jgi:cytochrome P450